MKNKDIQSRKWLLTLNNIADHGTSRDLIVTALSELSFDYCCMADEIGMEGLTPHTHIYIYSASPIRFSRLKKLFTFAHIDKAKGTSKENRNYVAKLGKWADDPKADTRVEGSFQEFGELPKERISAVDRHELLFELVEQGLTTEEIIETDKSFIFQAKTIDDLIQRRLAAEYKAKTRQLEVVYVYGTTGTGKTRDIQSRHASEGVCRITSYRKGIINFDAYKGEPVIVFEEFHSQINIEEMLNYLDIYPLMLPARYSDKVACYTTVYITANIPLWRQYPDVQRSRLETWRAFLRRIGRVEHYRDDGTIITIKSENGEQ